MTFRTLNVGPWDRIIEAWANDDDEALGGVWVSGAAVDLGSEWGQYEYVTDVGFAAWTGRRPVHPCLPRARSD